MPNKRDKDKVLVGGYLPREMADALKARAEKMGLTVTELIRLLITEELKRKGK